RGRGRGTRGAAQRPAPVRQAGGLRQAADGGGGRQRRHRGGSARTRASRRDPGAAGGGLSGGGGRAGMGKGAQASPTTCQAYSRLASEHSSSVSSSRHQANSPPALPR